MSRLVIALSLAWQLLSSTGAAACTLVQVSAPEQAKLKVYFTRFLTEDKTGGKYKSCKVLHTGAKAPADAETFIITPFRQDANLIVHKSNWP